jgi:hypothetical protein
MVQLSIEDLPQADTVVDVVTKAAGAAQRSDNATLPAFLTSIAFSLAACAAGILVFAWQKDRHPRI